MVILKIYKISPHITKLELWCFITFSAWLVKASDGVYIIDTGISLMGKTIWHEAAKLGEVKAVLLTHGHSDHVGGLKHILHQRKLPVFAHPLELQYLEGKTPYPGRRKREQLVQPGIVQPLPADTQGDLLPISSLMPYHTPGHSPGHVGYYHAEDDVFISGDLFTSKNGKLQPPMKMFTADMRQAIASAAIVSKLLPKVVSIAHSSDVLDAHNHIEAYLQQSM